MTPEELKTQARATILHQLVNAPSDEASVDLVLNYYKQGYTDGMKAGVKQTVLLVKEQFDSMARQLETGANDGKAG